MTMEAICYASTAYSDYKIKTKNNNFTFIIFTHKISQSNIHFDLCLKAHMKSAIWLSSTQEPLCQNIALKIIMERLFEFT